MQIRDANEGEGAIDERTSSLARSFPSSSSEILFAVIEDTVTGKRTERESSRRKAPARDEQTSRRCTTDEKATAGKTSSLKLKEPKIGILLPKLGALCLQGLFRQRSRLLPTALPRQLAPSSPLIRYLAVPPSSSR